MVIQHNLTAINANRMLGITTGQQAKASEKLSSGYRINRAADDAAGLTISEKMRKQIRGLGQASKNAEDGVSAVQTAEGALTEVHSMLQRMNELATQASNGTNAESDRQAIQDEISQLTTEIDRVAETTKFNEIYLLKGNPEGTSSKVKVAAHDAGLAGKLTDNGNGTATFELEKALADGDKVTIAGKEYTIGTNGKGTVLDPNTLNESTDGYKDTTAAEFTTTELSTGDSVTYDGNTYTLVDKIGVNDVTWTANDTFKIGDDTWTVVADTATPTANQVKLSAVADKINAALADGKQVTVSSISVKKTLADGSQQTAASTVTDPLTIVSSLDKGEVSSALVNDKKAVTIANKGIGSTATTTVATFKAGDSVTISGKKTIATEAAPASAKAVYDSIDALSAGNTVKVGSGADAVTYTLVDDDADVDTTTYKVTKEMVLSKIKDGMTVNVNNVGAKTVIGDIGSTGSADNIISVKTAYAKMTEELQKASSIGTDEEATVENKGNGKFFIKQGSVEVKDALAFSLHVGADADMTNKINVNIESMSAAGLGIKGINLMDINGASATYAVDAIADAIAKVSSQRSALGAVQNRLEHTVANLDNVVENTTSAESRIRDLDMAEEMVEFSKNNILAQAGQSMLAQANQSTQGVLSLLQ